MNIKNDLTLRALLCSVDYTLDDIEGDFVSDLCFTPLHMGLLERLISGYL